MTLDGGDWSGSCHRCFTTMESRNIAHQNQRLGGPLGQSGCFGEDNNLLPMLGIVHQTVQPMASYCTNCALLASVCVSKFLHFDLH